MLYLWCPVSSGQWWLERHIVRSKHSADRDEGCLTCTILSQINKLTLPRFPNRQTSRPAPLFIIPASTGWRSIIILLCKQDSFKLCIAPLPKRISLRRAIAGQVMDRSHLSGPGLHTPHLSSQIRLRHRSVKQKFADIGVNAVYGVGGWPLDCWDRGFESHSGRGWSSIVFVVFCVGSGLCDGLITQSEELYRMCVCVCVCVCVLLCEIWKHKQRDGLESSCAFAPKKLKRTIWVLL